MKKLVGILLLTAAVTGGVAFSTSAPTPMHSLEGTWELQSFCNYDINEVADTVRLAQGYRQVKMYYNGKVMWSRTDPNDTIGRFGFGTYYITTDELVEKIEFGDHYFMESMNTTEREFHFELIIQDNSYSQITIDEDGKRSFSENYKKLN